MHNPTDVYSEVFLPASKSPFATDAFAIMESMWRKSVPRVQSWDPHKPVTIVPMRPLPSLTDGI